jgi:RNA polymerase sigma-70 factor, ECF subfamily
MERYAMGDDAAFEEVYDALAPRLLAYFRRHTCRLDRAEDLLQQTFLQIHRGRASFLPGAEVTAWAFAIGRRLAIDVSRKDRRQVPVASAEEVERAPPSSREPLPDELVRARQLASQVERELARLPDAQRLAFELVKQDGLSIAEAAAVLGCTPTAVKLRAHRAYEALRATIGAAYEEKRQL